MKFSDNVIRENLDTVHVIRTEQEMEARDEYNSYLWDEVRKMQKGNILFSIPVRDLKIGESIYDSKGRFVAYRSS